MDIDRFNFHGELIPILRSIANASFVAIDLEMSGITTRRRYHLGDRSLNSERPTVEDLYQDMKNAAETYQVVQLGITCVEQDSEKGEKILPRPLSESSKILDRLCNKPFRLPRFLFDNSPA